MVSDLPELNKETYLGDGLYVSFDGYHIVLRAPREDGDHWVGLEPGTSIALLDWIRAYPKIREYFTP